MRTHTTTTKQQGYSPCNQRMQGPCIAYMHRTNHTGSTAMPQPSRADFHM